MTGLSAVFRRELGGYFSTPVAYVFIVVFLFTTGIFTFYLGQFFERGQADLKAFFLFHPWLYLFFLPAIAMRLWAEERKSGTIELLLTLPIPLGQAVLGKFLAAWAFAGIALALTFPFWITVAWLGQPDHGVILAGYLGSLLMAGGYLAIGCCLSALTRNQVIAFVLSVLVCFVFTVSGAPMVLNFFSGWAPNLVVDTIASFSFLTHFNAITEGVIDLRDLIYFVSLIAAWLYATAVVVDMKKAG
ncbi:ABC transporter permease subunit [Ferrovibrio sp.]|uniref:ABC transporter permease subunit n=1 Tax=Ferrovibrio sp. TaxID=1917215 RepID=UPI001B6C9F73|nr:ABC transporter permease subunit [Ferrovibrio sp.]MBP7064696.1 ABC transporter permease subunit [Ferrovibrio sp.]